MLPRAPAERHPSAHGNAESVVVHELELGGRFVGSMEIGQDEVARPAGEAVQSPDEPAGPDVVVVSTCASAIIFKRMLARLLTQVPRSANGSKQQRCYESVSLCPNA